jgi:Glycosyl transferase family 2
MSRVDVIIPCYKYGHFLRSCVESVLSQEGVDARVLIIDDASPDHTAEVATEFVRRDRRVEFRRHVVNQGHCATYNEGLLWATGDYTLLLSADDLLTPGALLRASRLMDAHPDVGFTYGRVLTFETDEPLPQPSTISGDCPWQIMSGAAWLEAVCQQGANSVASPEVTVRTRVQRELGGYRKELPHSGDMEMWLRFAAHASVGILNATQAYYRMHQDNMHHAYRGVAEFQQERAAFACLFREYGKRIPNADALQRRAYASLSRRAFRRAADCFERGETDACRQFLELAVDLYPQIRLERPWLKLGVKRLMGATLWRSLAPHIRRVLGRQMPSRQRLTSPPLLR